MPLWAAKKFHEHDWVTEILQLVQSKLLGGVLISSEDGHELLQPPHMSLVLLGSCIGVNVCPQSSTTQKLVASHMSASLHVSSSSEYVLCTCLPELALNEAAAMALRTNRSLLQQQLRQLNSLLFNGIASAGERGVLIVRFLLIHAMNTLQQEGSPPSPTNFVFLETFLKAFVSDFKQFPCSLKHLGKAKIFFNAFHRFFGMPLVCTFIAKGWEIFWLPKVEEGLGSGT
ncbi:hypothetical protein L7F22_005539 [Adiantum nelumboides]|nr:hypothetical protein [Adiantum nelumboides]